MATIHEATIQQSTGEIRKWTADFTDDLPSAVTVSSGTATHTPPSGAAATPTIATTSTTVTATIGTLSVTGIHYLDIQATYSNSEKSEVRIAFTVNYPSTAARSGMSDLITELRLMAQAGPNDYLVAGVPYWSDAQLQKVLDRNRMDVYHEELQKIERYASGGTIQYFDYASAYGNYEQTTGGTSIFWLEDSTGADISTALYTPDYLNGKITFTSTTGGTAYYLTGRSYDLHGAAAEVWGAKVSYLGSNTFDWSTDNMSVKRSQLVSQAAQMQSYHMNRARQKMATLYRSDLA
jgi:hypothetical protein